MYQLMCDFAYECVCSQSLSLSALSHALTISVALKEPQIIASIFQEQPTTSTDRSIYLSIHPSHTQAHRHFHIHIYMYIYTKIYTFLVGLPDKMLKYRIPGYPI